MAGARGRTRRAARPEHRAAPSPVGVANIDYDAKGQRLRIDYKNGASTFYSYDPLTFRLTQLLTRRSAAAFPGRRPAALPSPAGRAARCRTCTTPTTPPATSPTSRTTRSRPIYFRNKRVEPSNDYTYDALYRLIQATGREHLGQSGAPIAHSHNDAGRDGLSTPFHTRPTSPRTTATPWARTSSATCTTPSATSCRCSTAAATRRMRAGRAPTTTSKPA